MTARDVDLTEHDADFIDSLIASGRYKDAAEALRAGLRLLERETREDQAKLDMLRGLASDAFASLDRGDGTALEGEQQLADFIGGIGRQAACGAGPDSGREWPMARYRLSHD